MKSDPFVIYGSAEQIKAWNEMFPGNTFVEIPLFNVEEPIPIKPKVYKSGKELRREKRKNK